MERKSKIDIDEALQPVHQAAKQMGDRTHFPTTDKDVALAGDAASVEDILPPGYDKFYLSEQDQREFGIDPNTHEYAWIRNPEYWRQAEGSDRFLEFRRTNPGGEACRDAEGELVRMEDMLLVKRPLACREKMLEREAKQREEYVQRLKDAEKAFDRSDPEQMLRIRAATSEAAREAGYVGERSPTHELTLEQAYRTRTVQEILDEEAAARRRGRTVSTNNQERLQDAADARLAEHRERAAEMRQAAATGKKSFGGFNKADFLKGPARSR